MENAKPILLLVRDDRRRPGQWSYQKLTRLEKFKLMSLRSGTFLGLSIFFILVPILHFILVPGALILAIYFGVKALQYQNRLLELTGQCPSCEKPTHEADILFGEQLEFKCPNCSCHLKVLPQ